MSRLSTVGVFIFLLLVGLQKPAWSNPVYNAVADFGATNPSGTWSYGYLDGSGDFTPLNLYFAPPVAGLAAWGNTPETAGIGQPPYVIKNTTGSDVPYGTSIIQPPWLLNLYAAETNAVVRWTAPSTGMYNVTSLFQGIDGPNFTDQGTLSDVSIALNTQVFFTDSINGYGDTRFWLASRFFTLGDTVDFIVRPQVGSESLFDGTGLSADFNSVPEPGTMLLLGAGLLGLGVVRRRK